MSGPFAAAQTIPGASAISGMNGIEACVFDAYGTLFDISSVARGAREAIGDRWQALSDLWRTKQLQYTWLRSVAGRHADFWQVTGEALDFTLASMQLTDPALRARLMQLYLAILPYPEVPESLRKLNAGGMRLAILSNGTPTMLASAVSNAGLDHLFDAVLSVEQAGVFKPHPSVYQLATRRFALPAEKICFLSSNGWDAFSAKAFGFRVLWCNRFGQPPECIPDLPDGEITDLAGLPGLLHVGPY
jgi:2-haloacid dehalogenase